MPSSTQTEYRVRCAYCTREFDAIAAPFCTCLTRDRTLVCPACGKCFCNAPASYRKNFWTAAPDEMWRRKRTEKETDSGFRNPPADVVKRPLVLIVDDDAEIRAVARRVIEALGFGVVIARNGAEGLELARSYAPDAVLTDAMMPKLDGREMGRLLKEDPTTRDTRVIVMTSLYTDARYKYEALKQFKVDAYVAKPLDPDVLQDVLSRVMA